MITRIRIYIYFWLFFVISSSFLLATINCRRRGVDEKSNGYIYHEKEKKWLYFDSREKNHHSFITRPSARILRVSHKRVIFLFSFNKKVRQMTELLYELTGRWSTLVPVRSLFCCYNKKSCLCYTCVSIFSYILAILGLVPFNTSFFSRRSFFPH